MGLFFNKKRKEREEEYLKFLNIKECLSQDFEMVIDEVFTIVGTGTVVTGTIRSGICITGDAANIILKNGGMISTVITCIDLHESLRRINNIDYRSEHVGLALRGVSKDSISVGDRVVILNGGLYCI